MTDPIHLKVSKATGPFAIIVCLCAFGWAIELLYESFGSKYPDYIIDVCVAMGAILIAAIVAYGGIKASSTRIGELEVSQFQYDRASRSFKRVRIYWSEVETMKLIKNSVQVKSGLSIINISSAFYSRPDSVINYLQTKRPLV